MTVDPHRSKDDGSASRYKTDNPKILNWGTLPWIFVLMVGLTSAFFLFSEQIKQESLLSTENPQQIERGKLRVAYLTEDLSPKEKYRILFFLLRTEPTPKLQAWVRDEIIDFVLKYREFYKNFKGRISEFEDKEIRDELMVKLDKAKTERKPNGFPDVP